MNDIKKLDSNQFKTVEPMKPIQALMQKEVKRKEFLSILGFGAASVAGLGPAIKMLTGKHSSSSIRAKNQTAGFGSGPYGM